jgi:hypothetical protein
MITNAGNGCWFCGLTDEKLVFDYEFDTYVHTACIQQVLKEGSEDDVKHMEAKLMSYLLSDDYEQIK